MCVVVDELVKRDLTNCKIGFVFMYLFLAKFLGGTFIVNKRTIFKLSKLVGTNLIRNAHIYVRNKSD